MQILRQVGLVCSGKTHIRDTLTYEEPVNACCDNDFWGCCTVGAFTYLNHKSIFQNVSIGRYCSVAQEVWLGPPQHSTGLFSTHPFVCENPHLTALFGDLPVYNAIVGRQPCTGYSPPDDSTPSIVVGHDVWIGARVVIMRGVSIGHGAVIGAGSVVTKDVEPYTIVAGVPARPIRKRFPDDLIARFLEFQWWRYDMSGVSNRVDYGNPRAVLDYMERRLSEGTLAELRPRRFRVQMQDGRISLTPVK